MKKQKLPPVYLGMVEDCAGETIVIVATDLLKAQGKIYRLWRESVYKGFHPEIKNFADLNEWNGARLCLVKPNRAHTWQMLEGMAIVPTKKRQPQKRARKSSRRRLN